MVSAVLTKPGRIEVRDLPRPKPAEGELLIEVKSALTCGTDVKAYLRGHPLIPMPGPFGHEFAGVVVEKGRGAGKFRVGDAVMAVHSAPCLLCAACRKGHFNLCDRLMDTKVLGAFAKYLVLPRHVVRQNVFRKPADLSFSEAAFLEPLSCVVHGMEPLRVGPKDTVLIIGAGPIGLLHLMLAKSRGAGVLITGLEVERLATARELGADLAFEPSQTITSVRDFTDGMGVDYVFECTGQPTVWEASVGYVRRGGTVILFGGCKPGTVVRFPAERLHYDELTLRGTFHFTPSDVRKAAALLGKKALEVDRLISGTYPLQDIADVFARLSRGKGIKYALVPD